MSPLATLLPFRIVNLDPFVTLSLFTVSSASPTSITTVPLSSDFDTLDFFADGFLGFDFLDHNLKNFIVLDCISFLLCIARIASLAFINLLVLSLTSLPSSLTSLCLQQKLARREMIAAMMRQPMMMRKVAAIFGISVDVVGVLVAGN